MSSMKGYVRCMEGKEMLEQGLNNDSAQTQLLIISESLVFVFPLSLKKVLCSKFFLITLFFLICSVAKD